MVGVYEGSSDGVNDGGITLEAVDGEEDGV